MCFNMAAVARYGVTGGPGIFRFVNGVCLVRDRPAEGVSGLRCRVS